jgi:hypothetical protein
MEKRAFGRVAVLLGSACALTYSLPAGAQEFMRDRRIEQGPGYQSGDFEIHPGIAGEIGYDSNYFYRSDKDNVHFVNASPTAPPLGSGVLRVTPSLRISSMPSEQRRDFDKSENHTNPSVAFDGGVSGTYREYFSGDINKNGNQRNMSAQADGTVTILPGRPYNGSVHAGYTRVIQPNVFGNPDLSYNNDTIVAGADLAMQPDLGTLDWHFGYQFTGIFFEDSVAQGYNNVEHMGYTRGRWRFRPRTALLYDGSIASRSYSQPERAYFALHTTTPVRTHIGIEGLVTPRVSVLAMVGYTGSFASASIGGAGTVRQYDSLNALAEVHFFPTATASDTPTTPSLLVSQIILGFKRDAQASYLNDFVGFDRGYLKAEYFLAGRFLITLEGGVGSFDHPDLFFPSGTPMQAAYSDIRADATLFMEYRVLPSVGINATVNYMENFSNVALPVSEADKTAPAGTGNYYDQSWRRLLGFVGVRWMM